MSSIFISTEAYESHGKEAWQRSLALWLPNYLNHRIWCLQGDLGAGKTTFVQNFCAFLGVSDPVSSPTFGLVHEYLTPKGEPIYHFDLYRMKNRQEAIDIGIEDYLHSSGYCLIEWPQIITSLLPKPYLDLSFTHEEKGITLSVKKVDR